MAISYVGAGTSASTDSTGTSLTLTYPSGIASGDVAFMFAEFTTGLSLIATPSGWTNIIYDAIAPGAPNNESGEVWWKVLTGSETTFNLTFSAGRDHVGAVIVAYRGLSTTAPVATAVSRAEGGVTAHTWSGLAGLTANHSVVAVLFNGNSQTSTVITSVTPSGAAGSFTSRYSGGWTSGDGGNLGLYDASLTGTGTWGLTINQSSTTPYSVPAYIALAPLPPPPYLQTLIMSI